MKTVAKNLSLSLSVIAMASVLSVAHAADYSKTVNLTADVEFLAHVDDFNTADGQSFSIKNSDDLTVADSVGGIDPSWSIWTNAAVPVNVTFDVPAVNKNGAEAFMLHDSGLTGPNGEEKVKFFVVYQACGAGANNYTIGGPNSEYAFGSPFSLPQAQANQTACAGNGSGRLLVANDAMNYRPFLGNYTAPMTVLVADPS